MRVLMFGWEFPPHLSGGLGTACFGMTQALTGLGHEIDFVMPVRNGKTKCDDRETIIASRRSPTACSPEGLTPWKGLTLYTILSPLRPYAHNRQGFFRTFGDSTPGMTDHAPYDVPDLILESVRYGQAAGNIAREQAFDIIHAHDWMTVHAGINARTIRSRPFVLHIHSLEFDRSGDGINQDIYDIERQGMQQADHVIAVSHYTRNIIVNRYGISPEKVSVVHNAVTKEEKQPRNGFMKDPERKTVLFLGRVTFQKGPDYFVEAAARVLKKMPDVTFVMAGTGEMLPRMVERVAELRIGRNFHFTGFLGADDVERAYRSSDLYVMPSVSEPFGIAPLEAMRCDCPVIVSRQSGVSEILRHVMKVDFWNVSEMADKIIAVLRRPALAAEMIEQSREALRQIHWEGAAVKIENIYRSLTGPPEKWGEAGASIRKDAP